jgi:hypothetical protein
MTYRSISCPRCGTICQDSTGNYLDWANRSHIEHLLEEHGGHLTGMEGTETELMISLGNFVLGIYDKLEVIIQMAELPMLKNFSHLFNNFEIQNLSEDQLVAFFSRVKALSHLNEQELLADFKEVQATLDSDWFQNLRKLADKRDEILTRTENARAGLIKARHFDEDVKKSSGV